MTPYLPIHPTMDSSIFQVTENLQCQAYMAQDRQKYRKSQSSLVDTVVEHDGTEAILITCFIACLGLNASLMLLTMHTVTTATGASCTAPHDCSKQMKPCQKYASTWLRGQTPQVAIDVMDSWTHGLHGLQQCHAQLLADNDCADVVSQTCVDSWSPARMSVTS